MRRFIDILEDIQAAQPVTLYRGDSSDIAEFDISKTDMLALFGRGIYLTDNKRVANDYKSKGAAAPGEVLFRTRAKSQKDVIRSYAETLAKTIDANGVDHSKEIAYWSRAVPYSDGGDYGTLTNDLRRHEQAVRLQYGLEKVKGLLKTYEVRIKLDGTAVIQKKQGNARTVAFAVPGEMVRRTLKADETIDHRVLDVLLYHLKKANDRSTAEEIARFVREEDVSFRAVFTGIDGDSPLRSDEQVNAAMIEDLIDLGYTGIQYLGGISMGGGYRHHAYVFWDAAAINGYRIK